MAQGGRHHTGRGQRRGCARRGVLPAAARGAASGGGAEECASVCPRPPTAHTYTLHAPPLKASPRCLPPWTSLRARPTPRWRLFSQWRRRLVRKDGGGGRDPWAATRGPRGPKSHAARPSPWRARQLPTPPASAPATPPGLLGASALDASMLTGRTLVNLDSEDWGVVYIGCAQPVFFPFCTGGGCLAGCSAITSCVRMWFCSLASI